MYVYIQTTEHEDQPGRQQPPQWSVGFYKPNGEWVSESTYFNKNDAMYRVNFLNGGNE